VVEWGEGIFGIEAASKHYYGKASSELTPQEAARLASVLPSPRRYNPIGDQPYVKTRSNDIYHIMIKKVNDKKGLRIQGGKGPTVDLLKRESTLH
jgi:monofunctional biosynthetic peptidoglycan transglycosylase